jgi:hypothetical protein
LEDNKDFLIPPVLLKRFVLYSSVAVDGVPQYREEAAFPLLDPASSTRAAGRRHDILPLAG